MESQEEKQKGEKKQLTTLTTFMDETSQRKKFDFHSQFLDYFPGAVLCRVKLQSSGKDKEQLRINVPTKVTKALGLTVNSKVTMVVLREKL